MNPTKTKLAKILSKFAMLFEYEHKIMQKVPHATNNPADTQQIFVRVAVQTMGHVFRYKLLKTKKNMAIIQNNSTAVIPGLFVVLEDILRCPALANRERVTVDIGLAGFLLGTYNMSRVRRL